MGNLTKTYKPTDKDINVFSGTNLDDVNSNKRTDDSKDYNTYKNTTYSYTVGTDNKGSWEPNTNVTGADYTPGIRTAMDKVGLTEDVMAAREKTIDGTAFTGSIIADQSVYSSTNNVRENGNNFNRGNDDTAAAAAVEGKDGAAGTPAKADRNSSRVLDRSMFLNNFNTDILAIRGGSGVDTEGKYNQQ